MVEVAVTHHAAVGAVQCDMDAADQGAVGLDVAHPAEGGVGHLDTAGGGAVVVLVGAVLDPHRLEAGPFHDARGDRGETGGLRGRERPVQRRREGDGVACDGEDLHALADGAEDLLAGDAVLALEHGCRDDLSIVALVDEGKIAGLELRGVGPDLDGG